MSIIKEKRQQFVTALERARHNSSSSSLDEFNSSLSCLSSVESIDAFSDPFSSELSECNSLLNEDNLCDFFDPTQWSSSNNALDSLPGSLELCEWDLNRQQQNYLPLQTGQLSLDLSCGEDDFLATAEDTMAVLSRLAFQSGDGNTGQTDFIDIIDDRQCFFVKQISDSTQPGSKYGDLLDDMVDNSFTTFITDNKPERPHVLKKDPWLFDGSAKDLAEVPQLSTISPQACFPVISSARKHTPNVSTKGKRSLEFGVVIDKNMKCGKVERQKVKLTPEDILIRKEKNRLRSKAYRERRKMQIQSLQEQVILAKLEADIAKKQTMKLSKRR